MKNLLLLSIILFLLSGCGEVKPDPEFEAYYYSKEFVKTLLKTPSVATFCEKQEATIVPDGSGYRVTGWVDSQNSFGAMIRSDFEVKVHESGTKWMCDELTFAGEKYK